MRGIAEEDFVGVEPHPTQPRTDLHTYECLACDVMQTQVVPLAS